MSPPLKMYSKICATKLGIYQCFISELLGDEISLQGFTNSHEERLWYVINYTLIPNFTLQIASSCSGIILCMCVHTYILCTSFCCLNFLLRRFMEDLESNVTLSLPTMITLWNVQMLPRPCPYLVRHKSHIDLQWLSCTHAHRQWRHIIIWGLQHKNVH